ncbi:MAG: hypothetical protein IKR68_00280 [Lachnospiraceae bacterium]|nr:hypothetical protein [Lachnospiraceae bacterium]
MPSDWLISNGASRAGTKADEDASRLGVTGVKAGSEDEGEKVGKIEKNPGESTKVTPGRKSSPAECETCRERKYQDGSDEMVSFKSAAHISPEASASRVRAHEQEHVNNAYKKAAKMGGKVLQASVSIKTAICPECGRSYVEGGVTHTQIAYKEESPYEKERKGLDAQALAGSNFSADV